MLITVGSINLFFVLLVQVENDAGKWVKLTTEAMDQLGCSAAAAAYALAYSEDRQQEFLEEKDVNNLCNRANSILLCIPILYHLGR